MSVFKNIAKLSDKDAKSREAQFEAEMLALVSQGPPQNPIATPRPSAEASPMQSRSASVPLAVVPTHDGIQISVTANGQTTRYTNLESVPAQLRQQIVNAWIASPTTIAPPVLNMPSARDVLPPPLASTRRPKTMKVAMFLNLMIPGAGQFYLGQRIAGAAYAFAFLASFVTAILIFVHGYFNYLSLSTSGDILDGANLEQLAKAFPTGIISTLSAVGIVIYLASTIHLAVSRHRRDV